MNDIAELLADYEESLCEKFVESPLTRPVTVRLPLETVALIEVLADHYKTNRSAFLQEMIGASVNEFFRLLPQEKRMRISEKADSRFMDELSKHGGAIDVDVPYWRSRAKAYAEISKREQEALS